MKKNSYLVSVLLPVIQEDQNLIILVPKLKKILKEYKYEIIIIGSYTKCDESEIISKKLKVKYVRRKNEEGERERGRERERASGRKGGGKDKALQNNSYGSAIRSGLAKSTGKKIIIMDSDGSHDSKILPKMIKLSNKFDLIIASRYIKGGKTTNKLYLILLSRIINFIYSIILNIKIKDISNSFRLYDAKKIKSLKLFCNHFDIIMEILYKMTKNNTLKIKEIPSTFNKRNFGKTKRNFISTIHYLIISFKLRVSY